MCSRKMSNAFLIALPGVRESAVVAAKQGAREQVHAVLVLEPGADGDAADHRCEPATRTSPAHSQLLHLAAARAAPYVRHE